MNTIRMKFHKKDEAAYISHLDLQRVFARAFSQSGIPVYYTAGFHPHIYMTFSLPLSLGHESVCETLDFKSEQEINQQEWLEGINAHLPIGIKASEFYFIKQKSSCIGFALYSITMSDCQDEFAKAVDIYNSISEAKIDKKSKSKTEEIDLKQYLPKIFLQKEKETACAEILLSAGEFSINPSLVVKFLQNLVQGDFSSASIVRLRIINKENKIFE